ERFDPDVSVQFEIANQALPAVTNGAPGGGMVMGGTLPGAVADPSPGAPSTAEVSGHLPPDPVIPGAVGNGAAGASSSAALASLGPGTRPADERTRLNPDLTFTTFVTGK